MITVGQLPLKARWRNVPLVFQDLGGRNKYHAPN